MCTRTLLGFLWTFVIHSTMCFVLPEKFLPVTSSSPLEVPEPSKCPSKDFTCLTTNARCLRQTTTSSSSSIEVTVFITCNLTFTSTNDLIEFVAEYISIGNKDGAVSELNIVNVHFLEPLDVVEIASAFPKLGALRVSSCSVGSVILPGVEAKNLVALSVTRSAVDNIVVPSSNSSHLKLLDLSGNNLHKLEDSIVNAYPSTKLDFRENPLHCNSVLFWLLDPEKTTELISVDEWKCGGSFNGKPAVKVLEFMAEAEETCPRGKNYECSCSVPYILPLKNNTFVPMVVVDCSGRGMTQIPAVIPRFTTTLHMEDNKITSLDGEEHLVNFTSLVNFYLDNNVISKIDHLQGTWFGENFRLLSLKGNHFQTIPTHVFRTILSRNVNVHSLYFGSESWICDCMTTPDFQIFLADYQKLIKDVEDIRCGSTSDTRHRGRQIAHLSLETMCQTTEDVHMLDVLNGVMALLIVMIAVKLTYDWYNYRKTNQIPWIARRMP
ncbi:unnamed protein product [Notodromas monacha]|uniref:Uncharacterized protein n=1 Tax=Notodromas monacha TaxID=399045 RepID=A0A7R9BY61_9CRUS|nr:unnamed protein product [Notodromas monacha]CAG0922785.1 unnamed protein product [Notodromas monacha]